ncbi:hypothetical protein IMAU60117_01435 [Lactobacillus helveticus]|uniref:DUF4422 domain-containing protein n=2 Tax=Lactobacillus helveticus TaxID=1587 RepID=UPI0015626B05|nr:DUF4422 domain-containing protein [Lactobacillus helveticus]NRO72716.1 hypothetical protein [Lactobacillus helveticus]
MNNIYISTFGKKTIKVKNEIPIEVGSANRNNFLYSVRDDTGINISNENKYYGELTGLYWVWKNQAIQNDELVGFGHYNKTLNVSFKKAYELLVNEKKYNFLIAEKTYITPHAQKDELNAITAILKKYYPRYYESWTKIYNVDGSSNQCNNAQLFITTGKYFNLYCNFLFDVLKRMRIIIGDKKGSPYDVRYCAFMGERLLTVFIVANNLSYKEYSIKYANKLINIGRKVAKILHVNKKSRLYKNLQLKFGVKSSYKK